MVQFLDLPAEMREEVFRHVDPDQTKHCGLRVILKNGTQHEILLVKAYSRDVRSGQLQTLQTNGQPMFDQWGIPALALTNHDMANQWPSFRAGIPQRDWKPYFKDVCSLARLGVALSISMQPAAENHRFQVQISAEKLSGGYHDVNVGGSWWELPRDSSITPNLHCEGRHGKASGSGDAGVFGHTSISSVFRLGGQSTFRYFCDKWRREDHNVCWWVVGGSDAFTKQQELVLEGVLKDAQYEIVPLQELSASPPKITMFYVVD